MISFADMSLKIKNLFPQIDYTIVQEYSVIKISKKDPVSDCIQFKIMHDHIWIKSLNRCGEISGPILLDNIYKLAYQEYFKAEDKLRKFMKDNEISIGIAIAKNH